MGNGSALRAAAVVVSVFGAVSATVGVVRSDQAPALVAVALAAAWTVAGWIAARARPDHPQARLLLAVGTLHLAAFGISAPLGSATTSGWVAWAGAVAGNLLFNAGLVALALALALFPDGRAHGRAERRLVQLAAPAAVAAALLPALTSSSVSLAIRIGRGAVPAPHPLPLLGVVVDPSPALPLLVVLGVLLLVRRGKRSGDEQRRALAWPTGAAALLALLLLASPAGVAVVGRSAWSVGFVIAGAAVPFALLAGLTRYRLMSVDLYVTRVLAQAALAAAALTVYAVAAVRSSRYGDAVPAAVVVLAAVTASLVRQPVERAIDRRITGGRVRRTTVVQSLTEALTPGVEVERRAAEVIRDGLDVAWVRVLRPDTAVLVGHADQQEPDIVVPLACGGEALGVVECGPRHGGWAAADIELVRVLARHLALVVENDELNRVLRAQVEELTASRARLVRAEDDVRRRIERDLHDGVQQLLVALLARLELLRTGPVDDDRRRTTAEAAHSLAGRALTDLRQLVRGIAPPQLHDHGLVAAVRTHAALLPLQVEVDTDPEASSLRWPPEVEGAAYFVVLESLTNVLKHAAATRVRIAVTASDGALAVRVDDDGAGGADLASGSGLVGLRDRVEAVGGALAVSSAGGHGTTVTATFPQQVAVHD